MQMQYAQPVRTVCNYAMTANHQSNKKTSEPNPDLLARRLESLSRAIQTDDLVPAEAAMKSLRDKLEKARLLAAGRANHALADGSGC
jgi:hypothetical protein